MKYILPLLLCLFAGPSSAAFFFPHTISYDPGGTVVDYISKYNQWRKDDAFVRVQGECDSACTLVFGFIAIDHICATSGAKFGFHSAATIENGREVYAENMTKLMWEWYPPEVITALRPYGMAKAHFHPRLQYIPALKLVKECSYG
jgi:hypothetical protein